ncbi:hypothetical protein [Brucella pituitosa]|uniref:hypothetical protein n=1 Tax=Brucella pituitosa TaxID=571256 RepID=UPI003F4AE6B0
MTYRRYANAETNLFPFIASHFAKTGELDPVDFWAILTWKANRSKNMHRDRITGTNLSFAEATSMIAAGVHGAQTAKDRLEVLMVDWSFKLPTATAILTVLYPDEFTVYDVRVCNMINAFHSIKHRRFSDKLWGDYQAFKSAAVAAAPAGLSLREVDHYLWGKSWREDALKGIGVV